MSAVTVTRTPLDKQPLDKHGALDKHNAPDLEVYVPAARAAAPGGS